MKVLIDDVTVSIAGTVLVRDAALACPPGTVTALVGPNGSGKSTLLRAVYRALQPEQGRIVLDDMESTRCSPRRWARVLASMTQEHGSDFGFSVRDVVATGRLPHQKGFARDTREDRTQIDHALRTVGMDAFEGRAYTTLSGGEKQRVLLARALAQQPRVLVLDEPTNHLDVATRFDLLRLLRGLGVTVLTALHDLELAAAYADHVHVIRGGRVIAGGVPAEVLTPRLLADVFGVGGRFVRHPGDVTSSLVLTPLP